VRYLFTVDVLGFIIQSATNQLQLDLQAGFSAAASPPRPSPLSSFSYFFLVQCTPATLPALGTGPDTRFSTLGTDCKFVAWTITEPYPDPGCLFSRAFHSVSSYLTFVRVLIGSLPFFTFAFISLMCWVWFHRSKAVNRQSH